MVTAKQNVATYLRYSLFQKEDLDEYLRLLQEAKERDHRKLGKELDLFMTSQK